ncbi:MAG: low molecular weight phosphatase family protein [Candidatus Aenigmarchaeota archaeon]|nr:low molecular weight phosphatase family protein [Candidatus Aenigmarchaeota archaeon]
MRVLYICGGNVGRSQMAESLFNRLADKKDYATSAGTHVHDKEGEELSEYVLDCMKELNYDLSSKTRKQITPEMEKEVDKIIVMDKENLPEYIAESKKVEYWKVPDTKYASYEFHCEVMDEIKGLVEDFIKEIE